MKVWLLLLVNEVSVFRSIMANMLKIKRYLRGEKAVAAHWGRVDLKKWPSHGRGHWFNPSSAHHRLLKRAGSVFPPF
jgi:hypothetical protein